MVRLLIFFQHGKFFDTAGTHQDGPGEAFLGTNGAADATGRVGVRDPILIEGDGQVWTTRAVTTGNAEFSQASEIFLIGVSAMKSVTG